MQELVEYIAKWVVDDPEAVAVSQRGRGGRVTVRLEVDQEDMGRVIGKEGRIANAMRMLLTVSGDMRDTDVQLEIR
ncbi:MAG: KH domain-containing protein [Chloroflexi bacterium]|nr:KH domain-containing protein [Chloroflexota bacterium]